MGRQDTNIASYKKNLIKSYQFKNSEPYAVLVSTIIYPACVLTDLTDSEDLSDVHYNAVFAAALGHKKAI